MQNTPRGEGFVGKLGGGEVEYYNSALLI